jgi:hypothetical protein
VLIERLKYYCSINPRISIIPSATLPVQTDFDATVLPASAFLDPAFPRTETIHRLRAAGCVLICFGPAGLLPGCYLAGCDDFVKEPWSVDELEWRVRRLCADRESAFGFSWGSFTIASLELRCAMGSCRLSEQEQRILRMLARSAGRAVSREALYYGIWGKPGSAQSRVVDVHIASLRRKLRRLFPQSGNCIRSVRGVGYLIAS